MSHRNLSVGCVESSKTHRLGNREKVRPRRLDAPYAPELERLEDRALMSTCHVTRLTDQGLGKGFRGDLRYCINKVNAEPGPDAIDFNVTGTINLTGALPDLSTDIDIQGPGAGLLRVRRDTGGNYRIFRVGVGAMVDISGLTIANGMISEGFTAWGGGIYNAGNLTIRNSTVTGNTVHATLNYANGGGIYNHDPATLTIIESVISNNRSEGGEFAGGGGICNNGTASIYSSAIVGNVAENHSGNQSYSGVGAGISNVCFYQLVPAHLLVHNSTVHSNVAVPAGNGGSGGIAGYAFVDISHSTIGFNGGGGYSCDGKAQCALRNTIVEGNSEGDIQGTLASTGYNLIGNSNGGSGFAPTDILDVDPLLGPLQDNGGPTPTAALQPGSPAIDAGDNADAPEWDQRGPGFPRIVNGTIDIGSFEVQSSPIPSAPEPLAFLITANLADDD